MRVPPSGKTRALDSKLPLISVSRGHQSNGREQFEPPKTKDTNRHWDMLRQYLSSIDDVLGELRPIVEKIAVKNTVIVMVVRLLSLSCLASIPTYFCVDPNV